MSFRVQRRLRLTRGLGLNISKSGISPSIRTGAGSIGARGFSIRTGIPGFYYRKSWGKNSGIGLFIGLIMLVFYLIPPLLSLLYWAARVIFWLVIIVPINILTWLGLTGIDYIRYRQGGAADTAADSNGQLNS